MPPRRVAFAPAPAIVEHAVAAAGAGPAAGMVLAAGAGAGADDAEPDDFNELLDAAVEYDVAAGRAFGGDGVIEDRGREMMAGGGGTPYRRIRVHMPYAGGGGGGGDFRDMLMHEDAFRLRRAVARLTPGTAAMALGGHNVAAALRPEAQATLRRALATGSLAAFDQALVNISAVDSRAKIAGAQNRLFIARNNRGARMMNAIRANLEGAGVIGLRDTARAIGRVARIEAPIPGAAELNPDSLYGLTAPEYQRLTEGAEEGLAAYAGGFTDQPLWAIGQEVPDPLLAEDDTAYDDGMGGVLGAYGAPRTAVLSEVRQAATQPAIGAVQNVLTQRAMFQAIGLSLAMPDPAARGIAERRGLAGQVAAFTPLNGGGTRVGTHGRVAQMGYRVDPYAMAGNVASRLQAFVLQLTRAIRTMRTEIRRRLQPRNPLRPHRYILLVHYIDGEGQPRYASTGYHDSMENAIRDLLAIFAAGRVSAGGNTAAILTNVRQIELGIGQEGGWNDADGNPVANHLLLGATAVRQRYGGAGPRVRYPGLVSGQGPIHTTSMDGRREDDGWLHATRLNTWAMHSEALVLVPSEIIFPPELMLQLNPLQPQLVDTDAAAMPRYKHLCVCMAILVSKVFFTDSKNGAAMESGKFPSVALDALQGASALAQWTTQESQRILLSQSGVYGFTWLEEAHRLHIEAGLAEGEGVDAGAGLQKLADHLGLFIHLITREAGNQITRVAVPRGALKDRNAATPPHGHVYLYMVGKGGWGHTHGVARPLALLRGDRSTEPRFLCHYCAFDTYDGGVMRRHLEHCPVLTDDDENPSSTGKVFKSLAARYLKDDFRQPGNGEVYYGHFCRTCVKLLPEIRPDGKEQPKRARRGRNATDLAQPNQETPLLMMERQFDSVSRKRRVAVAANAEDIDLTEEGRECIRAGHSVLRTALLICTHCHAYFPDGDEKRHRCFCSPPDKLKVGGVEEYWFFDFESMEMDASRHDWEVSRRHKVIFVHLQNHDGSKAYDYNDLDAFCADVFGKKEFSGCTFIAHNGGRYDVQFILGWLLKHGMMPEFQTLTGSTSSILQLTSMGRRFIDSYRFLTMALASLSKTFKLPVVKGHFPHEFATELRWSENGGAGYFGPMPDVGFYGMSTMRGDGPADIARKQQELLQWHAEESVKYMPFTAQPWVMRQQMQDYCKDDVRVLRLACLAFRQLFLAMAGSVDATEAGAAWKATAVDPLQYMTLPQVGLQVFLSGLQVRVAHFPHRIDWRLDKEAYMWMESLAEEHGTGRTDLVVRHRGHSSDRLRFTVRGAEGQDVHGWLRREAGAPPEEDVALVYLECRDHGCPDCLTDREAVHPILNQTYEEVRAWSQRWLARLREELGGAHRVMTMRSCDWARRCEDEREAGNYGLVRRWQDAGVPLSWNDYFMGGEVDVKAAYCKAPPGWHIEHVDVTSMYPWVCVAKMLPTGHPTVLWDHAVDLARLRPDHPDAYFGIVRCRVMPPDNLVVPVLPSKNRVYTDGDVPDPLELEVSHEEAADGTRLVLDLHQRIGCWTTVELRQALDRGYTIDRVYEVHHFPPEERRVGLFRGYVDYFLRLKIEAEGWPASIAGASPEEKEAWCDEVARQNGGIGRPRPDSIAKNPGLRTFAKLMLNSLWGKFAQSPRSDGRAYINTGGDFDALFMNPMIRKDNLALLPVTEHSYIAQFKLAEKYEQAPARSNFYLAAFVTAHARVRLHELMRGVGERSVLYCDTDSVVYVCPDGRQGLATAPGLGNLSDELDDGVKCVEFISTGNKSYCKVFDRPDGAGNTFEMKQKGLTLHASNQEILTPDLMRDTVLGIYAGRISEGDAVAELDSFSIRSLLRRAEGPGDAANAGTDTQVYSDSRSKKFAAQWTKRRMLRQTETGVEDPVIIPTVPHGLRAQLNYPKMVTLAYLEEAWADQGLGCAGKYPEREGVVAPTDTVLEM